MIKGANNIHFVGIGGIGMSALAQLLLDRGKQITGSDRSVSPTTELLEKKGISILIGDQDALPEGIDVLVYSDAVHEDNKEREGAKEKGIPQLSYFEALGEVSKEMFTITVAGTHGKTTTTGMLGKMLIDAGENPTVVVGSIVKDFGSNYVKGRDDFLVVEGCEYKDHFLKIDSNILVITNIEFDHSDYFQSLEHVKDSFRKGVLTLPKEGVVVANMKDKNTRDVLTGVGVKVIDYTKENVPKLELIGSFNEMNAKAAKATAKAYANLSEEMLDDSLQTFKGTWRRFEYKGQTERGALVYDDYAHHPTAIRETLFAIREKFPDKKITIAFHPHLFSRTKSFFEEFAHELSKANKVILAPIYPAREEDTGEVSSDLLAEEIKKKNPDVLSLTTLAEIEEELNKAGEEDLILTMGAGDIFKVADKISE
ncbi:MAG: Mur ligase domain-containing protein [Candidatus Paceibacterota bacterium]